MPRSDGRDYLTTTKWKTTLRAQVLAKTGGVCFWCGQPGRPGRGRGLALCHLVPWPAGPNTVENLVPGCQSCHRKFDAARSVPAVEKGTATSAVIAPGRTAFSGTANPFEDCPAGIVGQQSGGIHV